MFYEPPKYKKPITDINKELALLEGELDDKTAKITFAQFLRRNLGFTTELLTGVQLAPYQIITLKGLLARNYCMCVWGRGVGKTFGAAIYCILQCLFEPGTNILIAGPTFRTARFIFNTIEKLVDSKEAKLLFDCMGAKAKRNDLFEWTINGGSIVAIPLNGEKIRGFRANILVIDEFLLMSEEMVEKVLMPYLVAPQNIKERLKIRQREDELIKQGLMTEADKFQFENKAKLIALSSASYKCEYLYRKYEEFLKAIYDPEPSKEGVTYFVSQLSWDAIPPEMVDKSVIEVAQSNQANSATFNREYCANFVDDSDGFYSMNKMLACTVPDGQEPTLKFRGDSDKKYLLSIDPNASNSETSDDFSMKLFELDDTGEGATVVHYYDRAGEDLKVPIQYLHYLFTNFNIVMIIADHAGGQIFLEAANESELFKNSGIKIKIFEFSAEKEGPEYEEELKKARKAYNVEHGSIAFTQVFNTESIRKMNDWMQGCFEFKKMWFGGNIKGNPAALNSVMGSGLSPKLFAEDTLIEAIDEQESLQKQSRYQCASIEVKANPKGTLSFDLPQIIKRDTSATRMRRDSYTSLLLGCWGVKCYNDLKKLPIESYDTFTPFFIQ
jgi:hypothetical protein